MTRPVDDATADKIAENNDRFRQANEKIAETAEQQGVADQAVPFLCECSDTGCFELAAASP